ncbi:sensor histidine kinase [Tenacibaculum sp. SDUM215027]|uniref:ATP-binding protein n=1 Tax=Tenacibaculum sp. SDUM215027 TaxID=3422596 RepID=UPI003D30EFD5
MNSYLLPSIYNCLGINNYEQRKYEHSNNWYEKAIRSTRDNVNKIRYYNNISINYRKLGDYKKSLSYYEKIKSNKYFDSIPLDLKAKIIDNNAYAKFKAGLTINNQDFYLAQKLKKELNDSVALIANYYYLSDYYYSNKKINKAIDNANKMYELALKLDKPGDRIEALDKRIKLEKNKKEALFLERINLSDSIQKARENLKIQFIAYIYNFQEERREKLKVKANLAESNLSLEQEKSQKQLWIFAVILTILSSIVYFFYKREKNKKEKAIEVYNTETRLAKKIHDELANDVYAVMSTLQNTSITDERLLTRVEKIYAQTRDISHENSPVLTGEHFENFLKQLFLDFTNDRCKVIHKGLQEVNINQLAKEKQIVVYRALQELLVNMKKYSEATLVLITFSEEKNKLSVAYQDNGIGVENLSEKNGLQNMEIRIKSVGGFITFESKQEKGFQAKFQFKK